MQKIWRQIGFTIPELKELHLFLKENGCKNESEAVVEAMKQLRRFKAIVKSMEAQNNAQVD